MTSSNGNIFRVTGPLWGESTSHPWIPLIKASDAELWCFLICAWTNGWANNRDAGDLRHHGAHYDVIVMLQQERSVHGQVRPILRPATLRNGNICGWTNPSRVMPNVLSMKPEFQAMKRDIGEFERLCHAVCLILPCQLVGRWGMW